MIETKTIPVIGMACSACSANVERKLNSLPGVADASVSLATRSALVKYDPKAITLPQMKQAISDIGYDLVIEADRSVEQIESQAYRSLKRKVALSWMFAVAVMAIGMGWIEVGGRDVANQLSMLLSLANIVLCGKRFYVSAARQLRHGTANMDTLVALSTGISFLFSTFNTFCGQQVWTETYHMQWHTYFDSSVMIITFVLTGRLLEERAKKGTAGSIRALMGLTPETAGIVRAGRVEQVPISTIGLGDEIEVQAGNKVPVDGKVTTATSFMLHDGAYVDESMITGEPTPALKQKGSQVLAGTILQQGRLRFIAEQIGENTALAHIIGMVQQAQSSKAPVQRIIDKVSLVFVPVVTGVAVITFLLWWLLGGDEALPQAIVSAVAVLVIACPCAMGLATPTALMVGIGKAARRNILIKDAAAIETLHKVTALVIDKTGTITIPNQDIDFTKADNVPLEERETLKPHAHEAMQALRRQGIEIYMMSGDREDAAKYWADKAGIGHWRSKVLPQDKEDLVRRLQADGHCVAMVGDGINDTQALAQADVGIAMGRGADVAMDVAHVTMMGDDLRRLSEAVGLSRRTVQIVWQNLFWAFIYNLLSIPLAAGALHIFGINFQISPTWASALMTFSSVSVILNSLRLKTMKLKND